MKESTYSKFINTVRETGLELKDLGLIKIKAPKAYSSPIQMWPNSEKIRSPFRRDGERRVEN